MAFNIIILAITIASIATANNFVELHNQEDHFSNIHKKNYVLCVFNNPVKNAKVGKSLIVALKSLADSTFVRNNNVIVEYINVKSLPFFDQHYDIKSKNAVKLFITSQMVDMVDFDEELDNWYKKSGTDEELKLLIETFLVNQITSISKEIADIEEFREHILTKRIIGFYSGSNNINFDRYFQVARKNIDFTFIHTFDTELKNRIYSELGQKSVPQGDIFTIVRHSSILNEFDNKILVFTSDFDLKNFSDFIEYEKFDKLRDPERGDDIFQKMLHKNEPLLLFVKDTDQNSNKFESFKEAIKELPKNMIYSYVDVKSSNVGAFHQIFTMSGKIMASGTLSIIWLTPMRKFSIITFNKDFNKHNIVEFVTNTHNENKSSWNAMRHHLYDFRTDESNSNLTIEEL